MYECKLKENLEFTEKKMASDLEKLKLMLTQSEDLLHDKKKELELKELIIALRDQKIRELNLYIDPDCYVVNTVGHIVEHKLTPKEAAAMLGVAVDTLSVWRCTKRYPIPYVKIGARVFYLKEGIEKFIINRTFSGIDDKLS